MHETFEPRRGRIQQPPLDKNGDPLHPFLKGNNSAQQFAIRRRYNQYPYVGKDELCPRLERPDKKMVKLAIRKVMREVRENGE